MLNVWGKIKELINRPYIVESGLNANGEYIKFSDGTMICNKTIEGRVDIETAWGSLFVSDDISLGNMPQQFTNRPTIVVNFNPKTGTQAILVGNGNGEHGSNNHFGYTAICRPNSRKAVYYMLDLIAIGKWK